jgi:hypothetical protein
VETYWWKNRWVGVVGPVVAHWAPVRWEVS